MASTRTPGIIVTAAGNRIINKEHYGVRLFLRLGNVDQDYAEQRLRTELARLDLDRDRKAHVRPLFRHCAARYLDQSRQKRSFDDISWHVRLLIAHIGDLEPHKVHDGTLEPFVTARRAAGAGATTINRTLEVVRTILNRAARAYRDDDGIPWLDRVPPMITMLPESPRPPCPITWDEQDRLLRRLPSHLATMALFAVNTGLRDSNLCGLQWTWEVAVPEIGRSVFIVPPEAFKSRRPHVVILNDAAWSIVQAQRGKHDLGVYIPRKTSPYHEQHGLAEGTTGYRPTVGSCPRSAAHLRRETPGCWRFPRRPCGTAWSRVPLDAVLLREPRHRPTDGNGESHPGTDRDGHDPAGRERLNSGHVDKWSRRGRATRTRAWFSGPMSLNLGAPDRMNLGTGRSTC